MPQRFARFSGSGPSHHTRSLAGFIIITFGFRFSVHTGTELAPANSISGIALVDAKDRGIDGS
jgi:hypothetical protein